MRLKPRSNNAIAAGLSSFESVGHHQRLDLSRQPQKTEDMAKMGYWTGPKGKPPAATLYASLLREITTKGTNARFQKTARGKFARA